MQLYLVRHAQSHNNANVDHPSQMQPDPPLTALGQQQAQHLADYLAHAVEIDQASDQMAWRYGNADNLHHHFDHVVCSPMHRTMQTAKPIQTALGIEIEVWMDIYEKGGLYIYNQGVVQNHPGMSRANMERQFPSFTLPSRITQNGWWRGKRESKEAARLRAREVESRLRARAVDQWENKNILLISHAAFLGMLLKALLTNSSELDDSAAFMFYNTSITRVDFWQKERIGIRYLNRINHLPSNLIS